MPIGLLGKKLGMTQVYDPYGRRQPVTAVQAGPCTVIGLRQPQTHGYRAVQVGFEPVGEKRLTKPQAGQFKKAGTKAFRYVRELRLPAGQAGLPGDGEYTIGQELTVELFQEYELVDVCGISIGKGFQGGMKRWHWRGGGATHGSMSHRRPGSIGSTTTPGRVWRGHHLPGHMGHDRVTVQNVRIVGVNTEHHLLLLQGALPGPEQGLVVVTKSRKRPGVIKKPQAWQEIIEEDETLSKTAKAASKKPKTAAKA
ncbi:MAG: 50S ribosomal protein L3 [Candidatus Omnitrophica bacterium]|nr:50S ribosomal protein L3 [Candidatus Omnitrophota bacterium]